ncbi:MAG: hypothetical protein AAFQ89_23460 [Cyanobacteria bacterium J06626_18]
MPRRADPRCIACAQLSAEKARKLHGQKGDGCWNEKRCHRKRSHYRNRRTQNEKRRAEYRQQAGPPQSDTGVETVSLEVAETSMPYANLYIWKEKRKDAPVHAIAASVYVESSKVLEVAPIHCAGYRRRQLERYVEGKVIPYLQARFGITHFSNEIRLEPIECPIEGCPLSDTFEGITTDG